MSLDITLYRIRAIELDKPIVVYTSGTNAVNGMKVDAMSIDDWNELIPRCIPSLAQIHRMMEVREVFHDHAPSSLAKMAKECGLYSPLWEPGDVRVGGLIDYIAGGLRFLKSAPGKFRTFEPDDSFGDYETLVAFTERVLEACRKYPDAFIKAEF